MVCFKDPSRFSLARQDPCTRVFAHNKTPCTDRMCGAACKCAVVFIWIDRFIRCIWHFFIYLPLVCIWTPIQNYFLECIFVYAKRAFAGCCFSCTQKMCGCSSCCERFWTFRDKSFPPDNRSLGPWKGKSPEQLDEEVEWISAATLAKENLGAGHSRPALFWDKIEPSDIAQGSLGDCWLLSAFACLAEWPGALQRSFITKERTLNGCYKIRLYDAVMEKYVTVRIDDKVPCHKGTKTPLFTRPHENEMWVLLLEKAFAKFCGSYMGLSLGLSVWALEAMTGDNVVSYLFDRDQSIWRKANIVHLTTKEDILAERKKQRGSGEGRRGQEYLIEEGGGEAKKKSRRDIRSVPTDEKFDMDKMFGVLEAYYMAGSLLAAATSGHEDTAAQAAKSQGIVQGHMYTIVKLYRVRKDLLMIKLRNPWGQFEWTGPWSDDSDLWRENRDVARRLKHKINKKGKGASGGKGGGASEGKNGEADDDDDGMFWMDFKDFVKYFDRIDVCKRSTGPQNFGLDHREKNGCVGPLVGCMWGCFSYWCLCRGCFAVWCARGSNDLTPRTHPCPGCMCCHDTPCCMV